MKFFTPNNIPMTKYLDVYMLFYESNFLTILKYFITIKVIMFPPIQLFLVSSFWKRFILNHFRVLQNFKIFLLVKSYKNHLTFFNTSVLSEENVFQWFCFIDESTRNVVCTQLSDWHDNWSKKAKKLENKKLHFLTLLITKSFEPWYQNNLFGLVQLLS